MTELIPFDNGEFHLDLRENDVDGFRADAPGLARALGFRDAHDLLRSIPGQEKGSELVRTPGGNQYVGYVTEAGFYRALGQRQSARISDGDARAQVERFQEWVYGDVLPGIRRGTLAAIQRPALPRSYAEALRELAATVEAKELAETKVAELEPAAGSWQTLAAAGGDYSVREAAQILDRDPAISTGQNRLFAYLREIGWLDKRSEPYQAQVDGGRLTRRVTGGYDHDGEHVATCQARVTPKGLHELHKRLGGTGPLLLAA